MSGSKGSVRFCLIHADYVTNGEGEQERPVIRLWGKTDDGKSVLVTDKGFLPYFYVQHDASMSEADLRLMKNRIMEMRVEGRGPVKVERAKLNLLGRPVKLLKIYVPMPADVNKFREALKSWTDIEGAHEYDIPFYKRYMIDKGITPIGWIDAKGRPFKDDIKADIMLDADSIETLDKEGYPKLRIMAFDIEMIRTKGDEKVILISFVDNDGFSRVVSAGDSRSGGVRPAGSEEELIKQFVSIMEDRDPDMIVGYNTDRFDFPKIAEKAWDYKIPMVMGRDSTHFTFKRRGYISAAQIKGRVHIDLYDFIDNIMRGGLSTEVLTLSRVAQEFLGETKDEMKWREIEKAWEKDQAKDLASYCLKDSEITLKLAENLLPQIFEISKTTGQLPFDVSRMSYSQLVEWLLVRRAYSVGELAPNRPKFGEIRTRRNAAPYTGGYVHPPKEGLHEKIALFDFQSLYPSITITHNVSPETLDCKDCKASERDKVPESDHYFCSKKKGFVPMVIEELVNRRMRIKKEMKKLGKRTSEYKRLNNRQFALKIIANASYGYYGYAGSRWYSRICAESITAWGRMYIKDVIKLAEDEGYEVIYGDTDSLFVKIRTKKEARNFLRKANNTLPGVMELDFRNMYESGIFVLSKSGSAAKKRYALIDRGGEITIRGFERVRRDWSDIAKNTQEKVIRAILKDKSPEKAVKAVRRIIESLKKGKVDKEDLVIHTQLTKGIDEYEQIGPHVVVARKMKGYGQEVHEGSTISYIITKGAGSISERAEPADYASAYDPEYYINNQVIPAALRVLSGFGYTEDDLLGKKRIEQVSLSDFVK
ncbi:MAG: hypothetical protein DRO99_01100 [Candidatus Aenigmatarchaeota archaeon]|nr:MAG: hypothetical protein DRO99_01100 [Candidatus Aenigmarchaeota archaeon]